MSEETMELIEKKIAFIKPFVPPNKLTRIQEVIPHRSRHLSIVLEDIYQPHNAGACLRTCECFGVQDIHIIENTHSYRPSHDVALGSDKWLSINVYKDTNSNNNEECLKTLKDKGYKIAATYLDEGTIPIDELDVSSPTAIVFGTEQHGIGPFWRENADNLVKLPMWGFTQSYNISVSVAISINSLMNKIKRNDVNWQLSEAERLEIILEWYIKSAANGEKIIKAQFG